MNAAASVVASTANPFLAPSSSIASTAVGIDGWKKPAVFVKTRILKRSGRWASADRHGAISEIEKQVQRHSGGRALRFPFDGVRSTHGGMGVGKGLVTSIGVTVVALGAAMPVGAARIIDEWRPGVAESGLGGDLTVDGYGVSGLGFYRVGSTTEQVRSLCACRPTWVTRRRPSTSPRHRRRSPQSSTTCCGATPRPQRPEATNDQAAAINVLSWWYAGR